MNMSKEEERECRRKLARLADTMVTAEKAHRQELVAHALRVALPESLRMLVELLVDRLAHRSATVQAGAMAVLITFGPRIVPLLEAIVATDRCEARLLRLAVVAVALGRQLPAQERVSIQMTLEIVAAQAPTPESRVVLIAASNSLHDQPADEDETGTHPVDHERCR
jgi:predicted Kef-type K+ transport protein